ncbi:MAG: hypothetical protein COT73_00835, partial [Bdellovibrio sp. CG10_big_fil_rev_8_21_14_0_10_47_8]
MKDLKLVDRTEEIVKKDRPSYRLALKNLQAIEFDWLLSPHQSVTTGFMVWRIKAKRKIGFRQWWNAWIFDERVERRIELPDALRQMSLLQNHWPDLRKKLNNFLKDDREHGKKNEPLLSAVPDWASPQVSAPLAFDQLQSKWDVPAHFFAIFPGSVWATKQWTEEGFGALGKRLISQGHSVVFMG